MSSYNQRPGRLWLSLTLDEIGLNKFFSSKKNEFIKEVWTQQSSFYGKIELK